MRSEALERRQHKHLESRDLIIFPQEECVAEEERPEACSWEES